MDLRNRKYYFNLKYDIYIDRSELDLSHETIIIQNFHFSRKL